MILLFFKKLHKFMDPVMAKHMSTVHHSIGPKKGAKGIRSAFKAYFHGHAAATLSQNQQVYLG
jgi:hypothetical protein